MTVGKCARPQTASAQILNTVSEGQCHRIHLTMLRRFSSPSLAYMCTKVALNLIHLFIHSFIHSFIYSLNNPFIHALYLSEIRVHAMGLYDKQ